MLPSHPTVFDRHRRRTALLDAVEEIAPIIRDHAAEAEATRQVPATSVPSHG